MGSFRESLVSVFFAHQEALRVVRDGMLSVAFDKTD